ncbi:hypothetical protein Ctob_001587 [Chrysochromulina tobinii]|uniref:Uncharacterized protein n=1 Tax=Chrysochromulina tobinii TaxID=1460289 RepID=A0A0M0JCE7_9EUKA|nr:hypothetical protein Ctob_001587 [Chrysochromulina tobinii]|eukprot:KOO24022.1 hypothetical protein Ctob_001587 [Chrysochromulina sp. CCMP291]
MWWRSWILALTFALTTALDAKWTPNGEAPAPFSTKARQQPGMNPAAFAGQGQAPLTPPSGGLQLTLGSLLVVYLANNWKIVLALQAFVLQLLQPFFSAAEVRRKKAEEAEQAAADAAARKARAARLAKAKAK